MSRTIFAIVLTALYQAGTCVICPETCIGCKTDNECTACKSGYYITSNTTCLKCPIRCATCSSMVSCDTCTLQDYWGPVCQHLCANCLDCNNTHGCLACNVRYYNDFNIDLQGYECHKCSENCVDCSSPNVCSRCQNGYFGTRCEFFCPVGCETCYSGTTCTSCKAGYYNKENDVKCECTSTSCIQLESGSCTKCISERWFPIDVGCCPCSSNCKNNTCSETGECFQCIDGKYGAYCNYDCPSNCLNDVCNRSGGCYSCKDGYYGAYCLRVCEQQIDRCMQCIAQTNLSVACIDCASNYFLMGNRCMPCSINCLSIKQPDCDSTTGFCNYGCKADWFGDRCDTSCGIMNCHECAVTSPYKCIKCMSGYYVTSNGSCTLCPVNCKSGSTCDGNNGSCILGCQISWSGERCNKNCQSKCSHCDQFNSYVCTSCDNEHYGVTCDINCSTGCLMQEDKRYCDNTNGSCIFGCKRGHFGDQCSNLCNINCKNDSCFRNNGSCSLGCADGFMGATCAQALEYKTSTEDKTFSQGLGIGLGVAGVLSIGFVLLTVVLMRKRYGNAANNRQTVDNYTTTDVQGDSTPTVYYQNLADHVVVSTRDVQINNLAGVASGTATSDYQMLNTDTGGEHDYSTIR